MLKINKNQQGFAAFYLTILILAVVFTIGASVSILIYGQEKISRNIIKSSQAYYAAEAGIEDALLRLEKKLNWSSPYLLNIDNTISTIEISDIIGGSRVITAEGSAENQIRRIEISYEIKTDKVAFYYGAQVGDGGLILDDNSIVSGNVFSNGSIIAQSGTQITGTAKVATNGNKIQGATISEDAYVDICDNSDISGNLTYGTNIGCTAGNFALLTEEITTIDLSINSGDINDWKFDAVSGGTFSGDYNLDGHSIAYLGPKKIEGSMTIQNHAQLFITGTLWVTGDITIKNEAGVNLDKNTYGSLSGMIISDGVITLENNSISLGSGESGSYLMYISTAALYPALIIKNLAQADILFTSAGWVEIQNNTQLREVTGYGIHLKNNTKIIYEIGLQDTSFISGPGGSWEVTSWKEIE